jgi:transcriptional regulator with XRE-family HTH domain
VNTQDPRRLLAERLRELREHTAPERKITQPELAQALGDGKPLSVPLISSWESASNPRIPPMGRIEGYAVLFGAPRSFDRTPPGPLDADEMTSEERRAVAELRTELTHLRQGAQRATNSAAPVPVIATPVQLQLTEMEESLRSGPWRIGDGRTITIVCPRWPQDMLQQMPYTDRADPDYIEMLSYSELDALVELHGHVRAANPGTQVNLRKADDLTSDDYTSHLALLGGIDWNAATTSFLQMLQLPVQQIADWSRPDGQYFEVEDNGKQVRHRAELDRRSGKDRNGQSWSGAGDKGILLEDVALFARAVNPLNKKRTVTICNGMYGRGTYGAVRALTDARFRDRNAEYLRSRFSGNETYCILTRVPIVNGATVTPDWTTGEYTLFEWSG